MMQTCGATRVLFPAAFVGLVVSVFTRSEPLAWVAAVAVGLIVWSVQRVRGRSTGCAVPDGIPPTVEVSLGVDGDPSLPIPMPDDVAVERVKANSTG